MALVIGCALALAPAAAAHNTSSAYPTHHQNPLSSGFPVMAPSLPAACVEGMAGPYPCDKIDLEGFVSLTQAGAVNGNDIWGWVDPKTGGEYAILGTGLNTSFVDVSDPQNPTVVGILPTRGIPDFVLWRDVKVDGNYAYVVSEVTGSGMQVFDLRRLRDATGSTPEIFDADAVYDEISNTHNIAINEETDTAYAVGTNTCEVEGEADVESGGLHMIDISDPLDPKFAGCALVPADGDPDTPLNNYVHDVECIVYDGPDEDYTGHEICFGSNEDVVVIYDVTDKSNPELISTTGYPSAAYTHQGSLTKDRRFFLFGDELDEQEGTVENTTTYIMGVSDLDKPAAPKPFSHETNSIDHNLYIHGRRAFESNYAAGLRILEFDNDSLRAGELNEVAFFDVIPGADPAEFAGTWSNYRFPSGIVVASAIENEVNGIFVLRPQLAGDGGGDGDGDGNGGGGDGNGSSCDVENPRTVSGTGKGETLKGNKRNDVIRARGGADTLIGRAGLDCLFGQGDRDVLRGGADADELHGGPRADLLKANAGDDSASGGGGGDRIRTAAGGDLAKGQKGGDTINTGNGDDSLRGGSGRDRLRGGGGDDVLRGNADNDVLRGGGGANTFKCGKGRDRVISSGDNDEIGKDCERVVRR